MAAFLVVLVKLRVRRARHSRRAPALLANTGRESPARTANCRPGICGVLLWTGD